MKKMRLNTSLLVLFATLTLHFIGSAQDIPEWVNKVGARSKPNAGKTIWANDYGAKADTTKSSTAGIQKAIDFCSAAGGGVVRLKPGLYVSGAIFIKSNVALQIDESVTILGSTNFADYPDINTRVAGIEMVWPAALINFIDVTNASLTGKGIVNARGKFCWDLYWNMRKEYEGKGLRWIVDYDAKRVRTVLVQNSSDITLQGLTFKNAGFWTVQLLYSHHLTVDGLVIRNNEDGSGPSTDGIDVDSSEWVLIENCDIDCNDDNFCLKAGRDWDGLRVNRPTQYVVIRKCMARRGAGLITLGSETSGGIRHIYCTDLFARHTDNGLRIKSAITRGGTVEDVHFVNATLDSVMNVFQFNLNWYPAYSYSELPAGYTYDNIPAHWKSMLQKVEPAEKGIPHAMKFYISNIKATNIDKVFDISGLPNAIISDFIFSDSHVMAQQLGTIAYASGWNFKNVNFDISVKKQANKVNGKEALERLQ